MIDKISSTPTITIEQIKTKKSKNFYTFSKKRKFDKKRFHLKVWQISLIYIASVTLVSLLLAYAICASFDDIYALTKTGETVVVTIKYNDDVKEIAKALKKAGIIKNPTLFRIYLNIKNQTLSSPGGEYNLTPTMNYDTIIATIKKSPTSSE